MNSITKTDSELSSKSKILISLDGPIKIIETHRDLVRQLKQGHRWIFANAFHQESARHTSGIYFLKHKGEILALGVLQPDTQLRFRVLVLADEPYFKKQNPAKTLALWSEIQWQKAIHLRKAFLNVHDGGDLKTNSFRLINGEGDGLPGLIVDIYGDTAVIKHDHSYMETLWPSSVIAEKLTSEFPGLRCVYLKRRNDDRIKGQSLFGELASETLFLENGLTYASEIRDAAKTGFFLDQRDNRHYIRMMARQKSVLNLFSYTGGFSVAAAAGGARSVTSVDIAEPAIRAVQRNFDLNNLQTPNMAISTDAFDFVAKEIQAKSKYDLVITDPPSFAPNEKSVPQATQAYIRIFADSLKLVGRNGFFAASSCSSHISSQAFFEITREAFSKARLRGTLVHVGAQPFDHPFPHIMEEFRYLKFALFRVD